MARKYKSRKEEDESTEKIYVVGRERRYTTRRRDRETEWTDGVIAITADDQTKEETTVRDGRETETMSLCLFVCKRRTTSSMMSETSV